MDTTGDGVGREVCSATMISLEFTEDQMRVNLSDDRALLLPVHLYPAVVKASPEVRANYKIVDRGDSVHCPGHWQVFVSGWFSGAAPDRLQGRDCSAPVIKKM